MNCQKDDLAIAVYSTAGNEGLVVRCMEFGMFTHRNRDGKDESRACWRTDRPVRGWDGRFSEWYPDAWLMPIRPDGITTEEVKELFSPSPAKESEKV
jgi:hypothetical protein